MKVKINKIILGLLVLLLFNSCKTSKSSGYTDTAFKQYLIDNQKMDKNASINDSYYDNYYSEYLKYQKKQQVTNNPYLKANQVYVYLKNNGNSYVFSIFSHDGELYTATKDIDSEYLTAPENGVIKLKQHIKLSSLGDFEVTNDILKVSRNIKTPFREWDENDTGYIKNDTIHFTASYISKKYEYKKKWLAKTHNTNFISTYQPNLKATKIKDSEFGSDVFIISGEFNMK
jgi:hypothetical protein